MTHSPFLGSGIVGQKPFMHVLISSKFAILVCSSFNLIWHSRLMPLSCTSRACAVPVARNSAAIPAKKAAFIELCLYSGSGLLGCGRVVVHSESRAPKDQPSLKGRRKDGHDNKCRCSNRVHPLCTDYPYP